MMWLMMKLKLDGAVALELKLVLLLDEAHSTFHVNMCEKKRVC